MGLGGCWVGLGWLRVGLSLISAWFRVRVQGSGHRSGGLRVELSHRVRRVQNLEFRGLGTVAAGCWDPGAPRLAWGGGPYPLGGGGGEKVGGLGTGTHTYIYIYIYNTPNTRFFQGNFEEHYVLPW